MTSARVSAISPTIVSATSAGVVINQGEGNAETATVVVPAIPNDRALVGSDLFPLEGPQVRGEVVVKLVVKCGEVGLTQPCKLLKGLAPQVGREPT